LTMSEGTIRWAAREGVIPIIFLPFPDMAVKGAQDYLDESVKAGRSLKLGQNVGLCRMVNIGNTYDEAMESARNGSVFLFRNFHSKFNPQMIPDQIEPYINTGTAFVGTVDDIRRKMSAVQEQMNPEYFLWLCDQGYLPIHEVKKQLELFGRKVMPEFMG
jgi:alkanesulfonate monooxygenase SsuD/methylene tetrahydromethanopterin reductase-like flavin-dependent oxidoreductase (luciferase family)